MKIVAFICVLMAGYLVYLKRLEIAEKRKFYYLLVAYNELYAKCKDVLSSDGNISDDLRKYLKKFKENFITISELRKYMVRLGHYIQEEETLIEIVPKEEKLINEEYKVFTECFKKVKQISLNKGEKILYKDTIVGHYIDTAGFC